MCLSSRDVISLLRHRRTTHRQIPEKGVGSKEADVGSRDLEIFIALDENKTKTSSQAREGEALFSVRASEEQKGQLFN